MEITEYRDEYKEEVIALILDIQNNEARINLTLDEQPDLKDITAHYLDAGGSFWVAVGDDGHVVGTIGLMKLDPEWSVLKKFFVRSDYRSKKIGLALYRKFLDFARERGFKHIILDTPSVATASHRFYTRAGFRQVTTLPIPYTYRNSLLYHLSL